MGASWNFSCTGDSLPLARSPHNCERSTNHSSLALFELEYDEDAGGTSPHLVFKIIRSVQPYIRFDFPFNLCEQRANEAWINKLNSCECCMEATTRKKKVGTTSNNQSIWRRRSGPDCRRLCMCVCVCFLDQILGSQNAPQDRVVINLLTAIWLRGSCMRHSSELRTASLWLWRNRKLLCIRWPVLTVAAFRITRMPRLQSASTSWKTLKKKENRYSFRSISFGKSKKNPIE